MASLDRESGVSLTGDAVSGGFCGDGVGAAFGWGTPAITWTVDLDFPDADFPDADFPGGDLAGVGFGSGVRLRLSVCFGSDSAARFDLH